MCSKVKSIPLKSQTTLPQFCKMYNTFCPKTFDLKRKNSAVAKEKKCKHSRGFSMTGIHCDGLIYKLRNRNLCY